jgi:hypothetical protein
MALSLTCPRCHEPQTVPDRDAGITISCPKCQAEYRAAPPAPPGGARPPRVRPRFFGLLALVVVGGLAAYLVFGTSRPTDYVDPAGVFTAHFPDTPATEIVATADPMILRWGERVTRAKAGGREYAVAVLDAINMGDQEVGPASRDAQMLSVVVLAATNSDGKTVFDRPATHDGHVARETVIVNNDDGRLTALRAVVGERSALRLTVTGSGDRDKPAAFLETATAFFDTVRPGPNFGPPVLGDPVVVSAAGLGAAYRTDPKTADAAYKDRWVRVTGPVTAAGADWTTFEMDTGGTVIAVRRAPRGRLSVPVRVGAGTVTVTGKCEGMPELAPGTAPRIVLADATVIRPASGK